MSHTTAAFLSNPNKQYYKGTQLSGRILAKVHQKLDQHCDDIQVVPVFVYFRGSGVGFWGKVFHQNEEQNKTKQQQKQKKKTTTTLQWIFNTFCVNITVSYVNTPWSHCALLCRLGVSYLVWVYISKVARKSFSSIPSVSWIFFARRNDEAGIFIESTDAQLANWVTLSCTMNRL